MTQKFALPEFLEGKVSPEDYRRWIHRKAMAHVRRDRKRLPERPTNASYKAAIHQAVVASAGVDSYTGEPLDWSKIGTYSNAESSSGRGQYKSGFALLPTIDHVDPSACPAEFRVCAWRTNDCKNDLPLDSLLALAKLLLVKHGYTVHTPA